ncbi:MAG TPA: universal stress protein [Planctomycetota bacterium]|nr:universal stress protein [Planctomycetota bacterium]
MDSDFGARPFDSILAPVDGSSAAEIGVRRSRALLTLPGTWLTLLHVGGDDESRNRVERLAAETRDWGVKTAVTVADGAPAAQILREIETDRYDLVLMTSRRRAPLRRALPGAVALRVLRRSPAPLLLYRPLCGLQESFFATERSEPARFRKILLMLDGSEEALRIVAPALRLARAFSSELILFHAVEPRRFTGERMESIRAYLAERADAAAGLGVAARLQIVVGKPVDEALRILDGDADTIALTTRGRSSWRAAMLGSTTSEILGTAEGPVLCLASTPALDLKEAARRLALSAGHPAVH